MKSMMERKEENTELAEIQRKSALTKLSSNTVLIASQLKSLDSNVAVLPSISSVWRRPVDPPIQFYARPDKEYKVFPYSPLSRCEEWSTLRQMLPSTGLVLKKYPPRWGSNPAEPVKFSGDKGVHFPIINSPMTSYVDEMHATHHLFKL